MGSFVSTSLMVLHSLYVNTLCVCIHNFVCFCVCLMYKKFGLGREVGFLLFGLVWVFETVFWFFLTFITFYYFEFCSSLNA